MNARLNRRILAALAVMIVTCIVVSVQPLQASNGELISFPNTTVGQTQTVQFTYTLLASSATAATVTITPPLPPFGVGGPLTFTLNPGQSTTFPVTFSPTAAGIYEGSFSISAVGGIPLQVKTTYVSLIGQGVAGSGDPPPDEESPITWTWPFIDLELPTETPETTVTPETSEDIAKLEAKLDVYGPAITDLRQRLDSLGWWLGRLTNGAPLRLGPYDTNPMPQTNTWEQLAQLEAKLDHLLAQPGEITIIEVYNIIVEINILMVEINQWVINLGGNVAGLETKLDYLLAQPGETVIIELYDIIVQINILMVEINQWVINLGSDVDGLEVKLDELQLDLGWLQADIYDIHDAIFGFPGGILDLLSAIPADIRANGEAIARLEAKADAGDGAIAALEVKADANAAAIGANGVAIAANAAAIGANGVAIAANGGAIAANAGAIAANGGAIAANGAAIAANGAAIAANALAIQTLQDTNNRIEDKLNQLLLASGLPAPSSAPDAAKITLTMGGGPLPHVPWEATVEGEAGAVESGALVTIYWPLGAPSTVTADVDGSFLVTVTTGVAAYLSVEVTQTVGGYESARMRIPAS